ncbi:energy transducer TonB [Fretibacter rubidus]|uniref:energy transducer TonB n=1 Tax=Fretibacter rubidus TaxID=570162 RepID=UPI00352B1692
MAGLISIDFAAPEPVVAQVFDIYPVADDIKIFKSDTKLKPFKRVEIPPVTPQLDTQSTKNVSVEPVSVDPVDFDWTPPTLDRKRYIINAADTDEQPLLRQAPAMPTRASRSGHCIMAFDVNAEGAPYNIIATNCSDNVFTRASVKAVGKWRYRPKVVGGQAVSRTGMRSKISFQLTDEAGRIIPE